MSPKYICLCNPHDSEWKLFEFEWGKEKYAPTYGTPITSGKTPEDAIQMAVDIFGINPNEVEVCY